MFRRRRCEITKLGGNGLPSVSFIPAYTYLPSCLSLAIFACSSFLSLRCENKPALISWADMYPNCTKGSLRPYVTWFSTSFQSRYPWVQSKNYYRHSRVFCSIVYLSFSLLVPNFAKYSTPENERNIKPYRCTIRFPARLKPCHGVNRLMRLTIHPVL